MSDSRCESHIKPAIAEIYNVDSGALAPQSDRVRINQWFRWQAVEKQPGRYGRPGSEQPVKRSTQRLFPGGCSTRERNLN